MSAKFFTLAASSALSAIDGRPVPKLRWLDANLCFVCSGVRDSILRHRWSAVLLRMP
jgi:hypothetical protein